EDLLRPVAAEGVLPDVDLVHREEAGAADGALQLDVDVVGASLERELGLLWHVRQEPVLRVAAAAAEDVPGVALVDLVTGDVLRVRHHGPVAGVLDRAVRLLDEAQAAVGEEREVRPQPQLVALRVPVHLPRVARGRRVAPVEEQVLAIRSPPSLGSMAPNWFSWPVATRRAGICPEASQSAE